jgi:hypothetical protein
VAVQEQCHGLKLEAARGLIDVLVIENEQTPRQTSLVSDQDRIST